MTELNIASQLLCDAHDNLFDTTLAISAENDLTTPVIIVRSRCPDKLVIVALPPNRRSHQLTQAASGYFIINQTVFRRSQLPAQIEIASGFVLPQPQYWH